MTEWVREMFAIRGATTCGADTKDAVLTATAELLKALLEANQVSEPDIVSIVFTATPDITTAFPAEAARLIGLHAVPLLGAQELAVTGAPSLCVRVLLHVQASRPKADVRHVYLHGAHVLRPELALALPQQRQLAIAIDGPAGAGKSTVARSLAERLGLRYLDTGAMYRALTWQTLKRGIAVGDEVHVTSLAEELQFVLQDDSSLTLNGQPLGDEIRSPHVNSEVSRVAGYSGVRKAMVCKQRAMAQDGGIVMEGRDIGTEVMPDAPIKVFLVADHRERARRRQLELQSLGHTAAVTEVAAQIEERDIKDSTRTASPLRAAADAVTIDCTHLSPQEVVQTILHLVARKTYGL